MSGLGTIAFVLLLATVAQGTGPFEGPSERVYQTYGDDVLHDGFCPREPRESLCDANFCVQDNHCQKASEKCCPVVCGGLMCVAAVPGVRRSGECPDFWKVPVEQYPAEPVNQCDIDTDCTDPNHKCCGTEVSGIRKCVSPKQ